MRNLVRQLLATAVRTLELTGPAAVIATEASSRNAARWLRRHVAGQPVLEYCVQERRPRDRERIFPALAIRQSSLRTLVCLDVVERFHETERLLEQTLPLLAPGGVALVTADVAGARPHEGLSRVLTPLGMERLVAGLDAAIVGWQGDADFPQNLFLVACRSPVSPGFAERAGRFTDEFTSAVATAARSQAWPMRFWRWLSTRAGQRRADSDDSAHTPNFSLHLPADGDWRRALLSRSVQPRHLARQD